MAVSKCAKCDNTVFEMIEKEPVGSEFKVMFIQCARCGTVVGIHDYYNIGAMLNNIKKHMGMPVQ